MLIGVLASMGELIIVTAVLMLSVVLIVPGIAVKGFQRRLTDNKAPVIIGIVILADHPSAAVTDIL